tara:strand:+ start:8875 stop:9564 length:690 start_codon:yes stop_codon:yes gene_type:complete
MQKHNINIDALNAIYKDINTYSPHPSLVKIIAVTKTCNYTAILSAKKNKIPCFGENQVQEFLLKKTEQHDLNQGIESHLIGHLQSNKVNKAVGLFDVLQTVDSLKVAQKINKTAHKRGMIQPIFIQINIGQDPNKHGFLLNTLFHNIELIQNLTHIHLLGLMTILPFYQKAQETQPLFYKMKKIQNKVLNEISPTCKFLSMGMSQDYIYALKEGATHLRIGTKLYGPRN